MIADGEPVIVDRAELSRALAVEDADREFFERHKRRHRIRRAAHHELTAHKQSRPEHAETLPGHVWFTAKRKPISGRYTMLVLFQAPDVIPADIPEDVASPIFDLATTTDDFVATGPMMQMMFGISEVGLQ